MPTMLGTRCPRKVGRNIRLNSFLGHLVLNIGGIWSRICQHTYDIDIKEQSLTTLAHKKYMLFPT